MVYYKNNSRLDIRVGDVVFKRGEITGVNRYIVHSGLTRVSINEFEKQNAEKTVVAKVETVEKPKVRKVKANKVSTEAEQSEPTSILEDVEESADKE
jgi:hypothetical protein